MLKEENKLLTKQLQESKDFHLRELKELKQKYNEQSKKNHDTLERVRQEKQTFELYELVRMKNEINRYIEINKALEQKL